MQSILLKILSLGWQKLILVGAVAVLLSGLTSFYVVQNFKQSRQAAKDNFQTATRKPIKKLPTPQAQQSESVPQDQPVTNAAPSQSPRVAKPSTTQPSTESTNQPASQSDPEPSSTSSSDHSASGRSSSSPSSSNQTPAQTTNPSPSSNQPAPTSSTPSPTPTESTDTCGNDVGNGNTLIAGPSGPSGGDNDRPFRSLTVHPTDSNTVIIGTERNGVLKTTDGGQTWTRQRKGIRHIDSIGYPEFWDLAISKTSTSTLLAATLDSPGPITGNYPSSMAGVYKTTDGGQTWSRINCGLANSRITSVAIDPTSASRVVIGVEGGSPSFSDPPTQYYDGGIYYTTDGGSNWSPATVPGQVDKNGFWYMLTRGTSPITYTTFGMNYDNLSENVGFIRSTDGGKTWTAFASELKNLRITNFDISADGQTIYASPRDLQHIKKSTDGGATWTSIDTNATGLVAVSPNDANLVIAANCCSVFRSTDGFATDPPKVLTLNKVSDIVFAPSDPSVVWLIAEGYLLYKSTDNGASFTLTKNLRSGVLNAGG